MFILNKALLVAVMCKAVVFNSLLGWCSIYYYTFIFYVHYIYDILIKFVQYFIFYGTMGMIYICKNVVEKSMRIHAMI